MGLLIGGVAVSLLLLGASVEVEVGTMRTVSLRTASELVEHVVVELEARGHQVTVRSPGDQLTGADKPDERFSFEVVGGVTMLRARAQRSLIGRDGRVESLPPIERDLPSEGWQAPLSAMLVEIFGEKPAMPAKPDPSPSAEELSSRAISEKKTRPTWPLWISGAGLITLGVGVGFGIRSQGSIHEVESDGLYNPQGAMLLDRAGSDATVANALMITGAVVMLGGLIVYLVGGS